MCKTIYCIIAQALQCIISYEWGEPKRRTPETESRNRTYVSFGFKKMEPAPFFLIIRSYKNLSNCEVPWVSPLINISSLNISVVYM